MREREIILSADVDSNTIEQAIDDALAAAGLTITQRDSLQKYPGCLHWHTKLGSEPGVLEVTFWPQQHRAWFSIQKGRDRPWIDEKMETVDETLGRLSKF